ncbi:RHS repeat-associated core domain-containing protein [Bordetella genomosp. 5]|nr:RHS repeat-associated core domain-containing protein [Bordetella genomosp. 5]
MGDGCVGVCTVANPITLNTGNKFESVVDFETQGQARLAFVRYYNSHQATLSSMGWGWRSNFDRGLQHNNLTVATSSRLTFMRPDGASYSFSKTSTGLWQPTDTDVSAKLVSQGTSGWTLTDGNDTVETYTYTGQLTSIKERSGYQQNLVYSADGKLSSVADSFGRSLSFTFEHGSIRTLTDVDGNVYTYNYGTILFGSDLLLSVTYPGTASPGVAYKYENTTYPYALTGIVDGNGVRYASWTYDTTLKAVSSQHGSGADLMTVTYGLTSSAGSVTTTNALGRQVVYTLSNVAGVRKITQIAEAASAHAAASSESFAYDARGYLSSHTDKNGNITRYVNDSRGNITSQTNGFGTPLARTYTTTWHADYNLPLRLVQPGLTTDYTYASGQLVQKTLLDTTTSTTPYSTQGNTRTWTYSYYPSGLLHTIQGPAGPTDLVTYTYDARGCVVSFTNQLGQTTTIGGNNGRCQPLLSSDPNGIATEYGYDERGRVIWVKRDSANQPSTIGFSYDLAGMLISTTFPDGSSLTFTYDDAHRLAAITNNLGESITYTLDALGGRTATVVRTASSVITKTQSAHFDELGRIIESIGAASQKTAYAYDGNSNATSTTDPRGKVYGKTFDALNRISQEIDPDGATTTFTYNGKDELIGVKDPRNLQTTYVRNGFGDVIQRTSPDTGTDVYWHDSRSNIVKRVDARGIESRFTYDAASRTLTKTFPASPDQNLTFSYDATAGANLGIGRLTSTTDQSGSTAYVYDGLGRVTQSTTVVSGQAYIVAYTYDAAGKVLSVTYPSGRIVQFSRDALGRVSGVTTVSAAGSAVVNLASGVAYQPWGPPTGYTSGNGLVTTLAHDLDYQPTHLRVENGAASIQNQVNLFDPTGNITAITDNVVPSRSQTITYDNLNRVASATGAYGAHTYTYDASGNRRTRTVAGSTETYGYSQTSNRLESVTIAAENARSFSYQSSGQLVQDNRSDGNTYAISLNADGRRAGVSLNGTPVGSYLYNAIGQRVQAISGSNTTHFIYDQRGRLLVEASASGGARREYMWLDDLPVALVDVAGSNEAVYYIHADQINTPRTMTDALGAVVWDYASDPFGVALQSGANVALSQLRFPGQYYDSEAELAQNWARDYDPTLGRYIQSDPIGLVGGVNTYAYALSNPLSFIDPEGLAACTVLFPDYPIDTGFGFSSTNLGGHGGVLGYDSSGVTRYYEYGRYKPADERIIGARLAEGVGNVRRVLIPNLVIGRDGQPTARSMEALREELSARAGKGTEAQLTCDPDADENAVYEHAERFANDQNRPGYSWKPWSANHCRTFARDAFNAGR